ncbi:acetyl esterase [Saccharopolyspora erythraea NRRL 2338]|uniref:Alpha/beta hydrolase fold-3 n=2 Tax=Saccharopolyspora erythraea TaxID=1836 RepID=A4F6G5_SACEN|nr:alpha/beta hydrolase [Saccharopolyspora erythraea]EQD88094.1 alpha/beta hydrolase [Saccharopolyspora erythraea D]PFG93442.1 acetyl esterase [Saccharopolyspora erythraea NRRL 2338]QRK90314.1 alpha/beta hydrolase [Saccharopolyspora erythraea]CAL99639.1 alpha/beta hydrolase fold-3 [Saccharopolyspora erythraea NRRL 2338]
MPKAIERVALQAQALALRTALALPSPVRRAIAGPPIRIDGGELALDAQLLLKLQHLSGHRNLSAPTVELARAAMLQSTHLLPKAPVSGVSVGERRVPGATGELAARLYRPLQLTEPGELLVFYHGGGFVIGDLESHDDMCRFLAKHAGIRVLSVEYRLAPESRFPAAFDDALAAYRYAVDNAAALGSSPEAIAVGGDSAGGNLAAVVAYHAARSGLPKPSLQLLLYPAVDATKRRRSRELFGEGFLLTDRDMDWFMDHYAPDVGERGDDRLSVLLAEDLTGLSPAYVVTAGFDPLRDEGRAYAERLAEDGVPVIERCFDDLIHGFASLRRAGGRFGEAMFEIAGTLRAALALRVDQQR